MPEYVLDHHQEGERERLALMSQLLDPMHRRYAERQGIGPGARTLEVGCGNGSISAWLAGLVGPAGRADAIDLDLSLVDAGPAALSAGGVIEIEATSETALYNGGSPWARYWELTIVELRDRLVASGQLSDELIDAFLARCRDPSWWTQTIAFTAVRGRAPSA